MTSCYYAGDDNLRLLRGEHDTRIDDETGLPRCPGDEICRGCAECPDDHCIVCTTEHCNDQYPLTCPTCVSAVRTDLGEIARMAAAPLRLQTVIGDAGRLASKPIPGGEAMVMLGPATLAHGRAWYDEFGGDSSHKDDQLYVDQDTPAMILGQIEDDWRDISGDPTEHPMRVQDSIDYLLANLTRMSQRRAGDFPANAGDVAGLRYFLEELLHDGERHDPGAPCVHCGTALVRKSAKPRPCKHERLARKIGEYFDEPEFSAYDLFRLPYATARAMRAEHETCDQGGTRDRYECLRCHRTYNPDQYQFAVGVEYLMSSPTLTARELEGKTGVPATLIRTWGSRGLVAKRGRDEFGIFRYDVAEVEAWIRDHRVLEVLEEQRREREAKAAEAKAAEAKAKAEQDAAAAEDTPAAAAS